MRKKMKRFLAGVLMTAMIFVGMPDWALAKEDVQPGYGILLEGSGNEIFADVPLDTSGMEEFTFTPEKGGYYSLQYLYSGGGEESYQNMSAQVFDADGNDMGEIQIRYIPYFFAGKTYTIVPYSMDRNKTVKISRYSDIEYPDSVVEGVMGRGTEGGEIIWLDENDVLTCEIKEGGSGKNISSFPLQNEASVKKLVIEEGIRSIYDRSFQNYDNLNEVTLPSTLEKIGSNVFSGCIRLSTVHLPQENSLVSVGQEAFLSTPFLEEQQGNYKMLGTTVIRYVGEERETVVPQNATVIGGHSMQNSGTLEKITISDKVKTIGEFGMADCESLPEIDVPGNVTDIQYGAFCRDTALERAVLREGVKTIGDAAFLGCDNLKQIDIPKSVSMVGYNAIGYSSIGYGGVYVPSENPPVIGCYYQTTGYYYALNHNLPKKILDEKDLGNENVAFLNYSAALGRWPIRLDEIGVSFAEEPLTEGEKKTVLTVTGIGDYFGSQSKEFYYKGSQNNNDHNGDDHPGGNTGNTGQNGGQRGIPGGGGTSNSPSGGTVKTDPKTGASYQVIKDGAAEYKKPPRDAKGTVVIPDSVQIDGRTYSVTGIAAGAFQNHKSIKRVQIGGSVTSVGKNAFKGCVKLSAVSGGKNMVSIGDSAFFGCTALKKITIGKKVSRIGKKAFGSCKKLNNITVKTAKLTQKNIGKKAFAGTPSNALVKVPKKKLKEYKALLKSKGIHKKAKIK